MTRELPTAERELLLAWNRTDADYGQPGCLHGRFQAQAHRTPTATALVSDSARMTYAMLNAASNRVAHRLRRLDVTEETRVGVLMERSCAMVAGVLGALKAGAAYVPLDPELPRDRLTAMIQDSGTDVLVSEERLVGTVASPRHTVCLDRGALEDEPASDPPPASAPAGLAYVIYTSGSTGRPKGVMVEHRAIGNRLDWMQEVYDLQPDDRVLQKTSVGFDVSVWELFWPLLNGATMVLARPGGHREPEYLRDLIAAQRVTVVHFVPSMLARFLEATGLEVACRSLRLLVASGEALPPDLAARTRSRLAARLENLYGPTEAAVDVTRHRCLPDDGSAVPIGRPAANIRAHILDDECRVVPIGAPGELYLGGVQVARGYLGQPGLTGERFVPDPFAESAGSRLYRTGDVARWRSDGEIEYLGRSDQQVKVRGHRVELGEIEMALRAQSGVREAVVVARGAGLDVQLVAYVVPGRPDSPPPVDRLREGLRRTLPEAMVPSVFVPLPGLPLTTSGKVDRRALPEPAAGRRELATPYVAARTDTEARIVSIWADLLILDQVGVDDDFFDLGGDSLLAMRAAARLRRTLGFDVPVRRLYDARTVARLGEWCRSQASDGAAAERIVRRAGPAPVPITPSQALFWVQEQRASRSPVFNESLLFRLAGHLDEVALRRSLDDLVRRHDSLRTAFRAGENGPVLSVAASPAVPLRTEDLAHLSSDEAGGQADRLLWAEARALFDLTRAPLVRALLVRLGELEHLLLLTFHHIAMDGWSLTVMKRDLETLYNARRSGRQPGLAEPLLSFADYAAWLREAAPASGLEDRMDFWRQRLRAIPALELPADHPRSGQRGTEGARVPMVLDGAVTRRLEALGRRHGASLFMVILAGFATYLGRRGVQQQLAIGTVIAGRRWPEVDDVVGFFLNNVIACLDLSGDPSFETLVLRAREEALRVYADQALPFPQLIRELVADRGGTPPVRTALVLQPPATPPPAFDGLQVEESEFGNGTAKFEVLVSLTRHERGLEGHVEVCTDLFDESTALRMRDELVDLLSDAAARPPEPLSRLGRRIAADS